MRLATIELPVKAMSALVEQAMRRARSPEATVARPLASENRPALGKLERDSLQRLTMPVLAASRLDRQALVSFAQARQRSIPSRG